MGGWAGLGVARINGANTNEFKLAANLPSSLDQPTLPEYVYLAREQLATKYAMDHREEWMQRKGHTLGAGGLFGARATQMWIHWIGVGGWAGGRGMTRMSSAKTH